MVAVRPPPGAATASGGPGAATASGPRAASGRAAKASVGRLGAATTRSVNENVFKKTGSPRPGFAL